MRARMNVGGIERQISRSVNPPPRQTGILSASYAGVALRYYRAVGITCLGEPEQLVY